MGRTVPSFRIVIAQEKKEWKPFRESLVKKEKKEFDEMWGISRLYVSACSNSVRLVSLHPIIISILFHHYKELKKLVKEVKHIEAPVNAISKQALSGYEAKKKEEEQQVITMTTIDSDLISK